MTIATTTDERQLTENEARELTAEIFGHLDVAWSLIQRAYYGRADRAMGYESWDAYCKAEFTGSRLRLPREERQEVVRSLRDAGMSTRAIASATGTDDRTVRRDIAGAANAAPDPEPAPVTGLDGKTYTSRQVEPEVIDAEIVDEPEATPKRRPLTDQARDAGWELRKATERVERVASDDRFGRNKKEVAAHLRGHLLNTVEVCQDLLDQLDDKEMS